MRKLLSVRAMYTCVMQACTSLCGSHWTSCAAAGKLSILREARGSEVMSQLFSQLGLDAPVAGPCMHVAVRM